MSIYQSSFRHIPDNKDKCDFPLYSKNISEYKGNEVAGSMQHIFLKMFILLQSRMFILVEING